MQRINTRMGSAVGVGEVSPFMTNSLPIAFQHRIFIKDALEHPEEMIAAIDILESSTEADEILIFLNSPGGRLDSLDTLLFAVLRCPAHTRVIASGDIASAAVSILLVADEFELSDNARILVHSASGGMGGKVQDVEEYSKFWAEENRRWMKDTYGGFLTEEELHDVVVNKREMYMNAEEFCGRFQRMLQIREEEEASQIEGFQNLLEESIPSEADLRGLTKKDLIKLLTGEGDLVDGKVVDVEGEEDE